MWRAIASALLVFAGCRQLAAGQPEKLDSPNLPNGYRLTDKVLSGGQPRGAAAFRQLRDLGVRTVISVDGAQPDVALAKQYGLRYVHMPHGYDGIPRQRLNELAKAVRDLPGAVYIHCHHGKHRSPAAAAAVCVALGAMDRRQALGVLNTAGTSPSYRGLFQSVAAAIKMDAAEIDRVQVEYRETVPAPPVAEAMIAIEHAHDALQAMSGNGWKPLAADPDRQSAHEALLLKEHFVELQRTADVKKQSPDFRALMRDGERAAAELEAALQGASADHTRRLAIFEKVTNNCKTCHARFRDVPLGGKTNR